MSLVAYASSGSDSENEEVISNEEVTLNIPKKREPVKISISSLKEFKDEEEKETVKKPKPKGGSGLFSLLPPPKNSTSISSKPGFTPYVFSKKKETKPSPKPFDKKPPVSATITDPPVSTSTSCIDEIEDTDDCTDFFSLGNTSVTENYSVSPTINSSYPSGCSYTAASESLSYEAPTADTYVENTSISNSSTNYYDINTVPDYGDSNFDQFGNNTSEPAAPNDLFNDEQFLKLMGRRKEEEINFIDVKADDHLIGKDELIMKSLTEEKTHRPFKRRHDMPTSQQKRKHQITYLAFQAKEREMDLKNQWAMNSLTKRETQAKYGF